MILRNGMARLGSLLRQYGARGATKRAILRAAGGRVAVHRVLFYAAEPALLPPDQGGRVVRADSTRVLELSRSGFLRTPAAAIRERLSLGHECVVAEDPRGTPSGYGWVARTSAFEDAIGQTFPLRPDEAYLCDFFVQPSSRGSGTYPRMLRAILGYLAEDGKCRRAFIATHADNRSSRRGIEKAGFRPAGSVAYWRAGSMERRRSADAAHIHDPPWLR